MKKEVRKVQTRTNKETYIGYYKIPLLGWFPKYRWVIYLIYGHYQCKPDSKWDRVKVEADTYEECENLLHRVSYYRGQKVYKTFGRTKKGKNKQLYVQTYKWKWKRMQYITDEKECFYKNMDNFFRAFKK